eukprot:6912938-Prymnesium_polylepis.1
MNSTLFKRLLDTIRIRAARSRASAVLEPDVGVLGLKSGAASVGPGLISPPPHAQSSTLCALLSHRFSLLCAL